MGSPCCLNAAGLDAINTASRYNIRGCGCVVASSRHRVFEVLELGIVDRLLMDFPIHARTMMYLSVTWSNCTKRPRSTLRVTCPFAIHDRRQQSTVHVLPSSKQPRMRNDPKIQCILNRHLSPPFTRDQHPTPRAPRTQTTPLVYPSPQPARVHTRVGSRM